MGTSAVFTDVKRKRIMGTEDFQDRLIDYMRTLVQEAAQRNYPTGAAHDAQIDLSAGGNDQVTVGTGSELAADGLGHLLKLSGSSYMTAQFENTAAITYYVLLRHTEIPDGVQINPRTGLPEYIGTREEIGSSADPDAVAVVGGGTQLEFTVDGVTESGVSNAGRTVAVWKIDPGPNATTEAVAVQYLTVTWDGSNNKVTAADLMGQTTASTTAADYQVALLGPVIKRNGTWDQTTADHFFVGEVTGVGAGSPPTAFDMSGQRVALATLDDLEDITARNATTDRLKIDVKSYAGDEADNQIVVRDAAGTIKFSVDGQGNVDVQGTMSTYDTVTVYSSQTITDNLEAGDAATDSHEIVGTWRHTDPTETEEYFRVDGTTGHVGINRLPDATNVLAISGTTEARHIVPETTGLYDLGASGVEWRNFYVQTLTLSGDLDPASDGGPDIGDRTLRWNEIFGQYLIANNTGLGYTGLSRTMGGVELSSAGMGLTEAYTTAVKFMSTDPSFTTENPKLLAAIVGRGTEVYDADSKGGMAIDFAVTANTPGPSSVPTLALALEPTVLRPYTNEQLALGTSAIRWGDVFGTALALGDLNPTLGNESITNYHTVSGTAVTSVLQRVQNTASTGNELRNQYLYFDADANDAGTSALFMNSLSFLEKTGDGTLTIWRGYASRGTVAAGTVDNLQHFHIANASGAGTITNQIGLSIDTLTAGANNRAISISGASPGHAIYVTSGTSFFGGAVGVGAAASSPERPLHIKISDVGITPVTTHGELVIEANETNVGINILSNNTGSCGIVCGDSDGATRGTLFYTHTNDQWEFGTAGVGNRMTLSSAGGLGIGVPVPLSRLDVAGDIRFDTSSTNDGLLGYASTTHIMSLTRTSNDTRLSSYGDIGFVTGATTGPTSGTYRMWIDNNGRVGIGTGAVAPDAKLHVLTTQSDGIFLEDASTSFDGPTMRIQGRRSDGAGQACFAGRLVLEKNRTDAALANNIALGAVVFGGNHTDGSQANIAYPAAIYALAEGTFSNVTTMPTAISFYTGSTGVASLSDVAIYGTERMRIHSNGQVNIGSPTTQQGKLTIGCTPSDTPSEGDLTYNSGGGAANLFTWRVSGGNSYLHLDNNATGGWAPSITIARLSKYVGINSGAPIRNLDVIGAAGIGEGTPATLHASHVAYFRNNGAAADQCRIGIISGTTGDSIISFGDKDDEDDGYIAYDNNERYMLLTVAATPIVGIYSTGIAVGNYWHDAQAPIHTHEGSYGGAGPRTDTGICIEDDQSTYLSILTRNSDEGGIAFGDPEDNDVGRIIYNHPTNRLDFWTAAGGRMYLLNNGNLGIGVAGAEAKLHIRDQVDRTPTTTPYGQVTIDGSGYNAYIAMDSDGLIFGHNSAGRAVKFQTNYTTWLFIDDGGDVGVGTYTRGAPPSAKFEVDGPTSGNAVRFLTNSTQQMISYERGVVCRQLSVFPNGTFPNVTADGRLMVGNTNFYLADIGSNTVTMKMAGNDAALKCEQVTKRMWFEDASQPHLSMHDHAIVIGGNGDGNADLSKGGIVVEAWNSSGSTINQYDCVVMDDPTSVPRRFQMRTTATANLPTAIGVAQEQITSGSYGKVMIFGMSLCNRAASGTINSRQMAVTTTTAGLAGAGGSTNNAAFGMWAETKTSSPQWVFISPVRS